MNDNANKTFHSFLEYERAIEVASRFQSKMGMVGLSENEDKEYDLLLGRIEYYQDQCLSVKKQANPRDVSVMIDAMQLSERISSDDITQLQDNQIFVFGSNESGRHGRFAAKTAMKWGAVWGQAEGLQGQTYGIPTKDEKIKHSLPVCKIAMYVNNFIAFAKNNPHLTFLVTQIGCGAASYTPADIAPLFLEAVKYNNIYLPKQFMDILVDKISSDWLNNNSNG